MRGPGDSRSDAPAGRLASRPGVAATLLLLAAAATGTAAPPPAVWLPFPAPLEARCQQGPLRGPTHRGYAWDFGLAAGSPLVAPLAGRVIWLVDDHRETGANSFDDSNHVFLDVGGGRYLTCTHHAAGTARVRAGDLVGVGTRLADVGATGTATPHVHMDLRGPSWHRTHDLRFHRAGAAAPRPVAAGEVVRSATLPGPPPARFTDSRLVGDEFAPNGVELEPGRLAFWLSAGVPLELTGRAHAGVAEVGFFLWQSGARSEYWALARPDAAGRFVLRMEIPDTSRGARWYRITGRTAGGAWPDVATLPAMVARAARGP